MKRNITQSRWFRCKILLVGLLLTGFSPAACNSLNQTPSNTDTIAMHPLLKPDAILLRDENNGTIIYLKGQKLSSILESEKHFRELQAESNATEIATLFIAAFRHEFKIADPRNELAVTSVSTDDLGLTHVRFEQVYQDIPIASSEIIVHLDRDNHVYLVNGRYIPTPESLNTRPDITPAAAKRIIFNHLQKDVPNPLRETLALIIFARPGTEPRLAFRIEILMRIDEGWIYFIDAVNGKILERRTLIQADHG